jgi:hypothetical protein
MQENLMEDFKVFYDEREDVLNLAKEAQEGEDVLKIIGRRLRGFL